MESSFTSVETKDGHNCGPLDIGPGASCPHERLYGCEIKCGHTSDSHLIV